MKPFNLEEAKARKPVCTRDGKEAKILDFDFYTPNYQDYTKPNHFMAVKIEKRPDDEIIELYRLNGFVNQDETESWGDLMMKTEKHEGWVNIYGSERGDRLPSNIFNTEEEAVANGKDYRTYITTTKIEWEE